MPNSINRRSLLAASMALLACSTVRSDQRSWRALAEDVKAQMVWAFAHYREKAWGRDEIKPVSGTYSSFPLRDHHLGLSLVEALDTLWVMGLDEEFNAGVDWVKAELDF